MTIKALLFDKDGTLIDFDNTWLPIYRRAHNLIADVLKKPHLAALLMELGGFNESTKQWKPDSLLASGSNDQILRFWERIAEQEFSSALQDDLAKAMKVDSTRCIPTIPDLADYFSLLKKAGYKIGVATMDDEASARHTLSSLGLSAHLDFVCGGDSGYGVKPDKGMFEAFCLNTGVCPQQTAMIGDSPRDLNMGRNGNAGLVAGVLTGASSMAVLQPLADVVFEDIGEIPGYLAKLGHP